ncbi:uncharacterized protein LOC123510217 [Portunus trituberculatus]|uniref:uncharacterized protein LOC123510217 n=1 Tax=Portunus trituberculatus TaxID=210409 RepID=UPI001E1CE4EE|nr:uncharacterized protein LOC123510217 [Portunus trituberculatus]
MFQLPNPRPAPSSSTSEASPSPSTPSTQASRSKRKVSGPQDPSPLHEAVSVLKSIAGPPVSGLPYVCGLMVQTVFEKYPESKHLDLANRLTTFLKELQLEKAERLEECANKASREASHATCGVMDATFSSCSFLSLTHSRCTITMFLLEEFI